MEKNMFHFGNIKKLIEIENFILKNKRSIRLSDIKIIEALEEIMEHYTYGWYIEDENILEQLKNINNFKIYIISLIK